jgi:hypothetical protein
MNIGDMAVPRLQAFVTYKVATIWWKLNALASIGLKDARFTVFKYPLSVRNKRSYERIDNIKPTYATLYEIGQQDMNLLKWSIYDG